MLEEHGPYLPAYTDGILSARLTELGEQGFRWIIVVHVQALQDLSDAEKQEESFAVARATDWSGYLGSPRLATAAPGERIWRSFATAAIDHALHVLDGADPAQFPRYADLLARVPLYQQWIQAATAHEERLDARQRDWLRGRPPR
jgi:hypothetical protein